MKHNPIAESTVPFQTPKTSIASTSGGVPPAPPPPPPPPVQQETAPTGITAAALQAVKLNKVSNSPVFSNNIHVIFLFWTEICGKLNEYFQTSSVPPKQAERPPIPAASSQPDFQSDLRNALAKRRSKVAVDDDDDDRTMNGSTRLDHSWAIVCLSVWRSKFFIFLTEEKARQMKRHILHPDSTT